MSELTVQDGHVVAMEYTLHVDGELLDTSEGQGPLAFLQGAGNIIPGLEKALYGMKVGDSKQVVVSPDEGYGVSDPEAFVNVPRSQFPDEIPAEVGVELQVRDQQDNPMYARISEVKEDIIRLDMNHPLADKELHFNITIVAFRDATAEEMEHGHAHPGDGRHHG